MTKVVLPLLGNGAPNNLTLNIDKKRLLDLIKKELLLLAANPLDNNLPKNAPGTIKRKKKDTALIDTGNLLSSIEVVIVGSGIEIRIADYYFYLKKKYFGKVMSLKRINVAINRAVKKWMKELVKAN